MQAFRSKKYTAYIANICETIEIDRSWNLFIDKILIIQRNKTFDLNAAGILMTGEKSDVKVQGNYNSVSNWLSQR